LIIKSLCRGKGIVKYFSSANGYTADGKVVCQSDKEKNQNSKFKESHFLFKNFKYFFSNLNFS